MMEETKQINEAPLVYDYTDYRCYIRDLYDYKKKHSKFFSYRYFRKIADLGSTGYLGMVMHGSRNLTSETIQKFIKGFNISYDQAGYFETLVHFNQSKSDKEKDHLFERLVDLRPKNQLKGITKDQIDFLSTEFLVVLHQMTSLSDFKYDPQWIADRLYPRLTPLEVKKGLENLLRLKLLTKTNNTLKQTNTHLEVPSELDHINMIQFHRDMLNKAKTAITEVPAKFRDLSSVTFPVSQKKIEGLRKKIKKFEERILKWLDQQESTDGNDEIYHLNVQLVPATKKQE